MKKLLLTFVTVLSILFAQSQVKCQANFSYIQSGTYLEFTDLSTLNTFDSLLNYSVTWEWDFGDGTISTQQNPVHTYLNNETYTPCLTVFYFDSLMFNSCISIFCDTLFIGNESPASWDCAPNTMLGCSDPETGLGQYSTLAACQAVCVSTVSNPCDSMTLFSTGGSPQTILMAEVPFSIMNIASWITNAPDGTILGIDSMSNLHQIFNNMNNGQPYDTIDICISYFDVNDYSTCCMTWIWDANSGLWAQMGSVTSLSEIISDNKKLIKIVDVLGREVFPKNNEILFYIYEDGTIDKRYIKE
tara:strand:+ start:137 stop:1042 length:906 start_codon:yes stop_codon:yes gene_type:complete